MNQPLETKKQPSEDYARERLAESPLAKMWADLKSPKSTEN